MSTNNTISEAVKQDHREIYSYHDQYMKAKGDADAQERLGRQLMWEIARHLVGEEIVVYPKFEEHLGEEGAKMAARDRKDHMSAKKHLLRIESLKAGSTEYSSTIEETMKILREHFEEEENHDLPALEKAIGSQGSQAAAKSFEKTKMFAPTRAHPDVPAPFDTAAKLLGASLDQLKDAFSKFPN